MKKLTNIFSLVVFMFFGVFAGVHASTLSCFDVDGLALFGYDGSRWVHIGAIGNEFNSLSIANEYGAGNEYKSSSIMNDYGKYGSAYSSYSAFNDYASKPPVLIDNSYKFVGYVTTGMFRTPYINTYEAVACASSSYRSPNSKMVDIEFKNIPSSASLGTPYFGSAVSYPKVTCPVNASPTSAGKCSCNTGYVANTDKSGCISENKQNDKVCSREYGNKSYWDGTKSGSSLSCACKSGYAFNKQGTRCAKKK